eukprot:scaffold5039_cov119-Cylindrotheca_fusiformis.AAC.4
MDCDSLVLLPSSVALEHGLLLVLDEILRAILNIAEITIVDCCCCESIFVDNSDDARGLPLITNPHPGGWDQLRVSEVFVSRRKFSFWQRIDNGKTEKNPTDEFAKNYYN